MKLDSKKLTEALHRLKSITGRRMSLPILSCVKLHTDLNRLHIAASNLDEYQVERLECDSEIKPVCARLDQLENAISGEFTDRLKTAGEHFRIFGRLASIGKKRGVKFGQRMDGNDVLIFIKEA